MRALVPRLQSPVHIVQPRTDMAVPMSVAVWMQERFKTATLDVIETAGHVPHITAPEAILEVLERRLSPLLVAG